MAIRSVMRRLPDGRRPGVRVERTELSYTSANGTAIALHRFRPLPITDTSGQSPSSPDGENTTATSISTDATNTTNTTTNNSNNNSNNDDHNPNPFRGRPAVLYLHGGGLVSGSAEHFGPDVARYAAQTGVTFYTPGYRLAPEARFPRAVEDAYAALEWLVRDEGKEGIDPARIAVMGPSAGGNLAAARWRSWRGMTGWSTPSVGLCCCIRRWMIGRVLGRIRRWLSI